ncbi:unnamed protein product [Clonostachys chloroleuca]|uniref:lytic cellulose monooxygenase (C4-dehydrogenating) n=1 Tax=Clonostachys chloroleuca TaxID=1926264 RepID=A0AA35MFJ0_9HYPO|nr:unnamed protein product [Clonostachys chloroleuca]
MPSAARVLASALAGAVAVSAHGYAKGLTVNGVYYAGYDVTSAPYQANPPTVIGWGTSATDLGFVAPDAFSSGDIVCHRDGTNAKGHATVAAGDKLYISWNTWPESHKGPVIDYLANCGDAGCETVEKTSLKFFKIAEAGLIDGSSTPGVYAADELIDNNLGWMVEIPSDIAPGNYVLRHEIIALHSGGNANGAQNYPQCFNLKITGSGTSNPEGVPATELYTANDAGILFSIYGSVSSYPIPGPALIAGASAIQQASSAATATGTATPAGGDSSSPTSAAGSSSAAVPTSAAASTSAAAAPTSAAATSAAPTSAAQTTAPASSSAAQASASSGDFLTLSTGSAPAASSTATSTASQPAQTTKAPVCKSKRSSKKLRRHVH